MRRTLTTTLRLLEAGKFEEDDLVNLNHQELEDIMPAIEAAQQAIRDFEFIRLNGVKA